MAYTRTFRTEVVKDGTSLLISKAYTADAIYSLDLSIANNSTDAVVDFAVTFSRMKWLVITSDKAILLESADGGSANGNAHTFAANSPMVWLHDSPTGNPFDDGTLTKITKLLVTNSSGAAASIQIECGYDPTP